MDAIVCDNGTGYLKIGSSHTNFPDFTIPCIIGRPNRQFESEYTNAADYAVRFI